MQVEDRIRRAEEIYARRKQVNGIRVPTNTVNNRKEYSLFKKMILQIIICLLIYFVFYLIKNSNYIFSEKIIEQTKNFLSYDINFGDIYVQVENFYNDNIRNLFIFNQNESTEDTNSISQNQISEQSNFYTNSIINQIDTEDNTKKEEAVLSESSIIDNPTNNIEESNQELSQMEIDANNIKENYSLIVPLQGEITSRFGPRIPTDIVSANHAGIDIGADEGTVFIASMEGKVTYISEEGGYGNHVWIQNDDVETLYAHCSNIYVKEGDLINQGEPIGEVGQTGNATGPHLHFEIRKSDRLVDPELILEF